MNEERAIEIETLKSIYDREFMFYSQYKYSILISTSMNEPNISLNALIKLDDNYPNSVPNINLMNANFKISHQTLNYLEVLIHEKAQTLVGNCMIYELMDYLKTNLEDIEDESSFGEFSIFSDELIFNIFNYLDCLELGVVSITCTLFNRITNDDNLWKSLTKYDFPKLYKDNINNSNITWKDFFQRAQPKNEIKMVEYDYYISISSRQNTGDNWPQEKNWKESFIEEFNTKNRGKFNLCLVSNIIGIIKSNEDIIGKFKFMDTKYMEDYYFDHKWYRRTKHLPYCEYTPEVLGWLFYKFDGEDKFSFYSGAFLKDVIPISRGYVYKNGELFPFSAILNLEVNFNVTIILKKKKIVVTDARIDVKSNEEIQFITPINYHTKYSKKIFSDITSKVKSSDQKVTINCWVLSCTVDYNKAHSLTLGSQNEVLHEGEIISTERYRIFLFNKPTV